MIIVYRIFVYDGRRSGDLVEKRGLRGVLLQDGVFGNVNLGDRFGPHRVCGNGTGGHSNAEWVSRMCVASSLQDLPDDVLALVSESLQPRDLCNMSISCKKLNVLFTSEKVWWQQCLQVTDVGPENLQAWRNAVSSYKVLCRFLFSVKSLLGIWVHQNPELGNMVYVMWGFMSVVGCRIIPQELGPRGFESGLLWAPVFEVIGNWDGSLVFFLHGKEREKDYCYPGSLKLAREDCNVLMLEVELKRQSTAIQDPQIALDEGTSYLSPENGASVSGEGSFRKTSRLGSRSFCFCFVFPAALL